MAFGDRPTNELSSDEFVYQHQLRRCEYTTEQLEVSQNELGVVETLASKALREDGEKYLRRPLPAGRRKVLIDTDIGTDGDDVLALLAVMGMPEEDVEVLGVTTNYHPTKLRKLVAQSILTAAGGRWAEVPVCAGPSHICGTHRAMFLKGNEGEGLGLSDSDFAEGWQLTDGSEAIELMYNVVRRFPGDVTIIAIGMATNVAVCARAHEDFEGLVGQIYVMMSGEPVTERDFARWRAAGNPFLESGHPEVPRLALPQDKEEAFRWLVDSGLPVTLKPNHNVSGDTLASCMLFGLRCPISVIPHWVTAQHWLEGSSIEALLAAGAPRDWVAEQSWLQGKPVVERLTTARRAEEGGPSAVARVGGRLLYEWLSRRDGQDGQCPHDPLTAYEAVYCDRAAAERPAGALKYVRGTFVCHQWAGFATFVRSEAGPHRLATAPSDAKAWLKWLEEALLVHIPGALA